jgi:hypothetical protein
MTGLLPRYLARQFLGLFLFSLMGAVLLFVIVDLVENVDQFIDGRVPASVTALYYLYFIPFIAVLTMPMGTMKATEFSVGCHESAGIQLPPDDADPAFPRRCSGHIQFFSERSGVHTGQPEKGRNQGPLPDRE